jgi:SagB-type dehydrogenase family enzyme
MDLPGHILERVERVYGYHHASKLRYSGRPLTGKGSPPNGHHLFPDVDPLRLPTTLLDVPLGTLAVLESSLAALPESFISPPQTLKTLASWLYVANGILGQDEQGAYTHDVRSCPSAGHLFPCEIYVAAFALQDVEPGLYHYNPRDFALRRLRDGPETLAQIKRGRPDLEFIKRAPAALLISTVYSRSSWLFGTRGYRTALIDAGHLVQNLVTSAAGLGIQTITRLRMNESTMRELIGLPRDAEYVDQESIQSMVVWADRTQREAILTHAPSGATREAALAAAASRARDRATASGATAVAINSGAASVATLELGDLMLPSTGRAGFPAIPRIAPVVSNVRAHDEILAVHEDCVAPGVAVREIRPPLTELSPLPETYPATRLAAPSLHDTGAPLRASLLNARTVTDFHRDPIPRDAFRTVNRLAFAGGSYFPLFPAGVQVALIRAFWVTHNVSGMDPGIWYYRADRDEWCLLRAGGFRLETHYLAHEDEAFGNAAAVCFMVANVHALMTQGGPDTYRLALLEAGTIAQRLILAGRGFGLTACPNTSFYDDELKKFLGLDQTGWEPLHALALGAPA